MLSKFEQDKTEQETKQQLSAFTKEKDAVDKLMKSKIPIIGRTTVYVHLTKRLNEATTMEQLSAIRSNIMELEKLILGL